MKNQNSEKSNKTKQPKRFHFGTLKNGNWGKGIVYSKKTVEAQLRGE